MKPAPGLLIMAALTRSVITIALLLLCAGSSRLRGAEQKLSQLRTQLEAAQENADNPATIELSKRILAAAPTDADAWETLAQTQLEIEDLDRLAQTLDAWGKKSRIPPPAIEDFRGALFFKRKDYPNAERHWLAYLATRPSAPDAAATYDDLASLCAKQERWEDHAAYLTKAIAAQDSAARRVARACAWLRLQKWDAAFADMARANKLDATDAEVKEWLPQFERLQKFLPRIKTLGTQIARSPRDVEPLLERARIFTLAGRPLLALDDARRALNLQPASMRARIQTAEALLDMDRAEEAAKLQVNDKLARAQDKHVSEQALSNLGALDAQLAANPKNLQALVERAKILRELRQFTLALDDARAALAMDDKSAAAQLEVARDLDALGRQKEALAHARLATDLDPNDPGKWFVRGVLERQRANFIAAIESQTRSLEINESPPALAEREQCERRIGKIREAEADLRRIQQLSSQQ